MESDITPTLLEKQLKTLGQTIRLEILKALSLSNRSLMFSEIEKELTHDLHSVNLSYHLNTLKDVKLVEYSSQEQGYQITALGRKILKEILAIENILSNAKKKRIIRTSKYSTEPFDIKNVEKFLMREANINSSLAKKISNILKKRLSKTNIKYLTTPLIREFVNVILVEEGLEEIRHKLTRLGVPPYDTMNLFNNSLINPNQFIKKLGSEVSEQFLLLNLLPKNLADLYLSRKIKLLHLNYWALKPLSIFINTTALIKNIIPSNKEKIIKIFHFSNILNKISFFFSDQLLMIDFDDLLNTLDIKDNSLNFYMNLLWSHLCLLNNNSSLNFNIGINLKQNFPRSEKSIRINSYSNIIKSFYNYSERIVNLKNRSNLIFMDYSKFNGKEGLLNFLNYFNNEYLDHFIFFRDKSHFINSQYINLNINESDTNNGFKIILDKIFLNLYQIALEAKQDDESFFTILESRLNSTFELFSYKEQFIREKLIKSKEWCDICKQCNDLNPVDLINEAIKSISFIGLNEAVNHHCGIELDRMKESENFALSILKFMNNEISDKNFKENSNFCLTQPLQKNYYNYFDNQNNIGDSNRFNHDSYNLIREDSNLNLKQKMTLYKKFSDVLEGGSLFEIDFNQNNSKKLNSIIDHILDFELPAFKFNCR
jgi:ribonucleoside-triphosphate reductase